MNAKLTRRDFIKVVSAAGGGLVLGFYVPSAEEKFLPALLETDHFEPNVWLKIEKDGMTTITVARSEMGQGVRTSMPMLVAEELEADWSRIRVEAALADAKYGDMTTGGSRSVRQSWEPLRKAGATAREMLIAAAAQTWEVERSTCRAENGAVIHEPSRRRLKYGELVEAAAGLPVPTDVSLKDAKDFRIIGQSLPRLDTQAKVDGSATFGLDLTVPDMLVATVARCPVFGGKVKTFDATKVLARDGVRDVVEISNGVAVVAQTTWDAMQGRDLLTIVWEEGEGAALDSAGIREKFEDESQRPGVVARNDGDASKALASAARRIKSTYQVPFLAHAPMEPMNCLADVRDDSVEVWAPTQAPQWAQRAVAGATGIDPEKVKIHTTLLGGGFGRRLMFDFVLEAVEISTAVKAPVKVVWTREDDTRHDFYRPASYHRLTAGLDESDQLVAWQHHLVAQSIMAQNLPQYYNEKEPDCTDGARQLPYSVANVLVSAVVANLPVPVGWWRSVYNTQNAFVNECFLDEIAAALETDPYEFRLKLLPAGSRLRKVLEVAADKAGWGADIEKGRGRGIACHASFGSFLAEVAEVSVTDAGKVRVHRVVAAVDCGPVVNPDTIKAQIESAIIFGLSATLFDEITLANGRVQEGNFDDYPMLTLEEVPEMAVHIIPSTDSLGGIGEPGVPPITPAVCNAIYDATGKRIRRLPIRREDLRQT